MRARHLKRALLLVLAIDLLQILPLSMTSAQTGARSSAVVENRIVIYPVADVYAFGGYSRSQLKFDISSIPPGSNIFSAKLWLYRLAADGWDGDITVHRVDDQLWDENITASEFDAQALTDGENHAGKFMSRGWDYLNVGDQLKVDHGAGHRYSSYRLRWANDDGSDGSVGIDDGRFLMIESKLNNLSIFFYSREFDGKDPYLEVAYYAVSVSISPNYQSGAPGTMLSYTVTVWNTGSTPDNYALTISDDLSWGLSLENSWLFVPKDENRATTIRVAIPPGAENCTRDNVRVIATGTGVSAENSCIAHAVVAPPPPPSPPPQPPPPGDNMPPPIPSLISPTNGAYIIDNTPTLDWFDVSDPSGVTYDLTIARDVGFTSIALQKTGLISSNYELAVAEALAPDTYYWRVRAIDGAGNASLWSESWSFTVSIAPPPPPPPRDNTPPPAPSLLSPTNGANLTDNTPLLDWSDVSDPSGVTYDLSIARDVGFTSIALQKTGLTASAYELALAETLMAGTYYWRVRAIDGAGNASLWSESWSFTVSIAPPPSAILLMTAIALLVIAIIAAIALYLIKRRKRKKEKVITSGPRQVAFKQTRR